MRHPALAVAMPLFWLRPVPAASARARDEPHARLRRGGSGSGSRPPSVARLRQGALGVESLLGVEGGQEGVKLEAQVPITEGVEILSGYPMDEDWL